MACSVHNHHTTSWFFALILALLLAETLLAHRSNALWTNTSSTPGGGSSSLQVPARRCRPEHAAALLQLKRSFTFTGSSNGCLYDQANTTLSSWIEGTDCCRWEGVVCDHVAGSVTGLDLSARSQSMGINGSGLHPALFSLTSLKHLVLDGNHFCGSHLPASGFERLTRLEGLSLRYCNISGPIPPSFSGLHSLKAIHLSYNNFNGPSTFPLWITHLKQLKVLDFQGMGLSGTIPSSIGNLSLLTELCLSGNYFSGGLPSSLSNLTYLSRLECTESGLSGRVPSLKNLSRLEFIDLSNNNLEGNIPLSEGNMLGNLQSVHMRSNSFTGQIQAPIFSQPALRYLDLRDNHLSGHIEEIQNPSTTLKAIFLSNNNLSGAIPTSFSQLRALTVLVLDSNNFMGTLDLYPYLMLRNLSSIRASNNPMLSVSAEDLGDSTNSSIIDTLELASCGLTRVPSVLKYLPKLDHLDLSNNSIHGNIPDWIWRNMSALYLQQNLFTMVGQLPAYTFIDVLDLSFNKLGGSVPFPSAGGYLYYSNNKFSSIPSLDLIRQFRTFTTIKLANNELRGPIPYTDCQQDDNIRPVSMESFITLFPRLPCHLKRNETWMKHLLSMESFILWFHRHLIPRLIESW